jgi:hypothetical protein
MKHVPIMNANIAPSRQAKQSITASKPGQVTGRLKLACDLMVYSGLSWDKAALQAGLTVRSMRLAMERPHVLRYLRDNREVFRVAACSSNILKLVELRDSSPNAMARVQAIKALEGIEDESTRTAGRQTVPGLVVVIQQSTPPPTPQHIVEATALPSPE